MFADVSSHMGGKQNRRGAAEVRTERKRSTTILGLGHETLAGSHANAQELLGSYAFMPFIVLFIDDAGVVEAGRFFATPAGWLLAAGVVKRSEPSFTVGAPLVNATAPTL